MFYNVKNYYIIKYLRKEKIHLEVIQHLDKGLVKLANPQRTEKEEYIASILKCLKSFCLQREALQDILRPQQKFMHKLKRITGVSMKRTSRVLPSILGASWQWMLSVMQSPHFEQPLIYPAINRNIIASKEMTYQKGPNVGGNK